MKRLAWNAVCGGLGVVAALAIRRLTASLWPGSARPPLNPADRRVGWAQAVGWAAASGIGAALARVVSRRAAAAGWARVFDETPPGVSVAGSST